MGSPSWQVQNHTGYITNFVTLRYCEPPPLRHKSSQNLNNISPTSMTSFKGDPYKTWNLLADKSSSPNIQPLTYLAQGHRSRWLSLWRSRSRNPRRSSIPPPRAWKDPRQLPGTGTRIRRLRRRWESGASRCWREWERRVEVAGASSCVHAEMTRLSRRSGPLTLWHSVSEEYPPARRECRTPVPRKSLERCFRNLRQKNRGQSRGTTILPSVNILLAFNGTKLSLPHLQRPVIDLHTASHACTWCF